MKNLGQSGVGFPLEDFRNLPEVKNAWMYRGRLHLAVPVRKFSEVKRFLNGNFLPVDGINGTVVLRSTFQTAEAATRQEEARNARETKILVQQHYKYILKSIAHTSVEPDLEYYSEGTIYERQCKIEDENDNFNSADLSVPAGFVGHYYPDEF